MLQLAHKKLDVYQIALELVQEVYSLVKLLPKEEQFGLANQLRKAAVSVCSNIAEGSSRNPGPDRKRFYIMAPSSLVEIATQLEIVLKINYFNKQQIMKLGSCMDSIFRMLSKMITNFNQ